MIQNRAGVPVRLRGVAASYRRGLFGRTRVLADVSLDAGPGTLTAIVGPNGAGKTTLLSLLMGFRCPDVGECRVGGMGPPQYRRAQGIGYLPETPVLPRGWTVQQFLGRACDLSCPEADRAAELRKAVERARVDSETLRKPLTACSKGTRQRVAFAWARAGDAPLLVLDEPFSGLDPASRAHMRAQLLSVRERGSTLVMASHDLTEVDRLADAVLVMREGRLREFPAAAKAGDEHETMAAALERELLGAEPSQQ